MTDFFILANAGLSLLTFLILHVFLLRRSNPSLVFKRLFASYGFAGVAIIIPGLIVYRGHSLSLFSLFLCLIVSWIFYTFFALIYILTVFGIAESSVRIRVLSEIYEGGNFGKTRLEILKRYNRERIIKKRLGRFLESGEVISKNGYLIRQKKITPYMLPDLIVQLVWKVYGGMDKYA